MEVQTQVGPVQSQKLTRVGALARVAVIDLAPINEKLRHSEPSRWDVASIEQAEAVYRKFLALHLLHRGEDLVPNTVIDDYWHQHILDTRKYVTDCSVIFGEVLHHDPMFGMRGEEDRRANAAAFERTKVLWQRAFGEPLLGEANPCSSTDCR